MFTGSLYVTEVPWWLPDVITWVASVSNHLVVSVSSHLSCWCSLGPVSAFSFTREFCSNLVVLGVAEVYVFLGSAAGSAGVFVLWRVNRFMSASSECTRADTHSFSDLGKKKKRKRLESMGYRCLCRI